MSLHHSHVICRDIASQNDDGLYELANGQFPVQYIFETLIGPLENLMGQRKLYMHLRAKLMIYLNCLYIWGPAIKFA